MEGDSVEALKGPRSVPQSTQPEFEQRLGLLDSTLMVAGTIIGSGIFVVSAEIARQVGSPGWLLAVWIISGLLTMIAALTYGELAAMMPRAGGQYVYLREAYGPMIGFLYGWTLFLVIQSGSIAAVAVAFARFLGVLMPWVSSVNVLLDFGSLAPLGRRQHLLVSSQQLVAMAVIALLTGVNLNGIQAGKLVQNVFAVAKLGALAGLILLGALHAAPGAAIYSSRFWTPNAEAGSIGWQSFLPILAIATVGSFFAYDAWNNITFTAGEVVNPGRNLPLSLGLGTAVVMAVYVLVNLAYLCTLPIQGIQQAAEDRVATAAAQVILGRAAESVMAVAILIATFGSDNGMILAGARVYYAMARDRLFFRPVGRLNRRHVPGASLLLQGTWASWLTLSGTYSDLVEYVIFAALLFYVLTVLGVFRLRRRQPERPRPYKAFGYPLLPLLYVVAATVILVALLLLRPRNTWPGLLIVAAGVPAYLWWSRRASAT